MLQTFRHRVERLCDARDLVVARDLGLPGQVAVRDGIRGRREVTQSSRHTRGDGRGEEQSRGGRAHEHPEPATGRSFERLGERTEGRSRHEFESRVCEVAPLRQPGLTTPLELPRTEIGGIERRRHQRCAGCRVDYGDRRAARERTRPR